MAEGPERIDMVVAVKGGRPLVVRQLGPPCARTLEGRDRRLGPSVLAIAAVKLEHGARTSAHKPEREKTTRRTEARG